MYCDQPSLLTRDPGGGVNEEIPHRWAKQPARIFICMLSSELCTCYTDIFLSSRPRIAVTTAYITVVVVVVDSHIQRIVLATEETTVTQQVSKDLSNANPACGHKEVRRSTGHIIVTTRYSDQQGSKSRQKVCGATSIGTDQYQNGSSNLLTPYREQLDRLEMLSPTDGQRSQQQTGKITLQPVLINKSKFFKATYCTEKRKTEILPRSMVVEALSW